MDLSRTFSPWGHKTHPRTKTKYPDCVISRWVECFQLRWSKKNSFPQTHSSTHVTITFLEGFSYPAICYFNGRVATEVTITGYQHSLLPPVCNMYTINRTKSIAFASECVVPIFFLLLFCLHIMFLPNH
jgi:hypothetical protein